VNEVGRDLPSAEDFSMRIHAVTATCAVVGATVIASHLAYAQNPSGPPTWTPDIKFASGRNIAPYFEGWIRNPDDTFDFVFGYFNRNTEEDLAIPAGPDNSVVPGGPDRGQPTYFVPRRQPRVFRVRVPKDWGDKTLTWSITVHGRTERVIARLLPAEEINEHMMMAGGSNTMRFGEDDLNQPPTIAIAPVAAATVAAPLTLTALVSDDGLPRPRPEAPTRQAGSQTTDARFQSQRNSSTPNRNALVGLRVTWLEYRGPGKVTFESNPIAVASGKAVTTARFTAPGTYTLVAMANDGRLSTRGEVVVTVK
jgi:hypothetical protein